MFKQAAQLETLAGKNRTKLLEARQAYNAISTRYGDTRAGKDAAAAVKRLEEAK